MKRISVLLFITLALFAACSPKGGSCIISGIPTNILIDCQTGVIIGRDMPMEVLESKLEELVESKN